ncbi:MAG: DUF5655 domain-containing protein [Bacteroidota bacterium]
MKTSEELEQEFIAAAKEKTGEDLDAWMGILEGKAFQKMKETVDFLKKDKGINHMNATFIAGIYLNGGKPVHDSKALFNAHFDTNEDKLPIYQALEKAVKALNPAVQVVPTKGYISFRNGKEYAVAKITKKNIRVGLDLGDLPFDDYTQKAKSLGTMPRITHMVEITSTEEINDKLKGFISQADKRVNG